MKAFIRQSRNMITIRMSEIEKPEMERIDITYDTEKTITKNHMQSIIEHIESRERNEMTNKEIQQKYDEAVRELQRKEQ